MSPYKKKLFFIIPVIYLFMVSNWVSASPLYDQTNGLYTDDFANNSGVPTRSYVNVNTSTGKLQLTNTSSQTTFTTPYRTSGYAITGVIRPTLIAKWGKITLDATVPENTTLKVQVMDDSNTIFSDTDLPGNSSGISATTIDISNIPVLSCAPGNNCNKPYVIKLKFLMTTSDISVTPTINNLSITWVINQGDLSGTGPSNAAWATQNMDQKNTLHSPYSNLSIYPAFKWLSSKIRSEWLQGNYILDDKIIGSTWYTDPSLFAMDKTTGGIIWYVPYVSWGTNGVISKVGTFYSTDIGQDGFSAIDTNTGELKWAYNFAGGHGNSQAVLDEDGTIYTIRQQSLTCSSDVCVAHTSTLYAFNPDGSIKFTKDYTLVDEYQDAGEMAIDPNGILYFSISTRDVNGNYTNHNKLYAVDSDDGSLIWEYAIDDLEYDAPTIDSDGTIYVKTSIQWDADWNYIASEKRIFAINSDGTLKWVKGVGQATKFGYNGLSLRSDNILLAIRGQNEYSDPYILEAIDTSNGSLIWSKEVNAGNISFTDSNNAVVLVDSVQGATVNDQTNRINYYDSNYNLKWRIVNPYNYYDNEEANYIYYSLDDLKQDELGWFYGSFGKTSYYDDIDWESIPGENYFKYFALSPWTLTNQTESYTNQKKGDTLNFSVKTSMLATNPLFSGNNQMQVVMDNGDKISLTYSSTDSNNDTTWTGSYTLPTDIKCGSHTYTIEAAQTYLQTDVTTHFASAPTESNNTGITTTGTFTAFQCSGGGLPPGAFNPPKPGVQGFKININNQDQKSNNSLVNLELLAGIDTKFMSLSNNKEFTNATLEPYQLIKSWDLCAEAGGVLKKQCQPGEKTVYVKFYTEYGYSSPIVHDSIILTKDKEPQVKGTNTQLQFTYDLYYGLKNNSDVKRLQEFLITQGYLKSGLNTGNYYSQTQTAVKKLQKEHNITPANGRFGPLSRALVNKMIN